jgi:hypothetical protein
MKRARRDPSDDRVDPAEYATALALFVREPTVRHCLRSIANDCLTEDIVFTEDGKALAPKFSARLQFRFKTFARECVEYIHACAFVPWYLERVGAELFPRTLPLGSFTWEAQYKQPHELSPGAWPIKLVLRGIDLEIDKLHVRVFYVANPLFRPMSSPLDTLHAYYKHANLARADVAACVRSSMRALVLVSETVDVKIQTESGLDLLDASRRYSVGGATGNEYSQRQVLMSADSGAVLNNVNEAQMCWLSKIQATHDNLGISLMPPNSQATHISAPQVQTEAMNQLQLHYRASVHAHFDVRERSDSQTSSATVAPGAMIEQRSSVLNTARVLEDFLPHVYKAAFRSTSTDVTCTLTFIKKLELTTLADVKVLCECGILGPLEVREMLAVELTKSRPDPCRLVSFAAKPK